MDVIPNVNIHIIPDDPDKRSYNVNFDKIQNTLGYKTSVGIHEGIKEILHALEKGIVEPDDPTTHTLQWYKSLITWGQRIQDLPITAGLSEPVLYLRENGRDRRFRRGWPCQGGFRCGGTPGDLQDRSGLRCRSEQAGIVRLPDRPRSGTGSAVGGQAGHHRRGPQLDPFRHVETHPGNDPRLPIHYGGTPNRLHRQGRSHRRGHRRRWRDAASTPLL